MGSTGVWQGLRALATTWTRQRPLFRKTGAFGIHATLIGGLLLASFAPGSVTAAATTLFDDFSSVSSWSRSDTTRVVLVTQGSNTALRLNVPAQNSLEASKSASGISLANYEAVQVRVNLNGGTMLCGDAGALYLEQGGWKYARLCEFVTQGSTQWQTLQIPLTKFRSNDNSTTFNKAASFSRLGVRFWTQNASTFDIDDIAFVPSTSPAATATAVPPTSTRTPTNTTVPATPTKTSTPQAGLNIPAPSGSTFANFTNDPVAAEWWKDNPARVSMIQVGTRTVMRVSNPAQGSVEVAKPTTGIAFTNYDAIEIILNLNGSSLLCGDAGALYLGVDEWFYARLCEFVTQSSTQYQAVRLPLSQFKNQAGTKVFAKSSGVSRLGIRIWNQNAIQVDVASISFIPAATLPTNTPIPTASATLQPTATIAPPAPLPGPPSLPNGNLVRCGPGWFFSGCGGNGEYGDGGNDTYWRGADGDTNTQWSSLERLNSYYQVGFQAPVTLAQVSIVGRGGGDQLSGQLEFSDGSVVPFGTLNGDGCRRSMSFPSRNVTSFRFKVTGMGNRSTSGFREIEAYPTKVFPDGDDPSCVSAMAILNPPSGQPMSTCGVWQVGNIVCLNQGTRIYNGPTGNLNSNYHTTVPVANWVVKAIGGPRYEFGWEWWDVSRKDAGDPSGGTGWIPVRPVSTPQAPPPAQPSVPSAPPTLTQPSTPSQPSSSTAPVHVVARSVPTDFKQNQYTLQQALEFVGSSLWIGANGVVCGAPLVTALLLAPETGGASIAILYITLSNISINPGCKELLQEALSQITGVPSELILIGP